MARALGIDPGTISFDVCGLDEEAVFLDASFPTAEIATDVGPLLDLIGSVRPVDIVVGPSGYGLPWIRAEDLGPRELNLLLLPDADQSDQRSVVPGMSRILQGLKESGLRVVIAPGVVHLPSVPDHRKVNRIDMGTADKLCAVVLGVWDQAREFGVSYEETSFVYVELGGAFTAVIAVEQGLVVDGAGGTSGPMGYLSLGAMDCELGCLLGALNKGRIATGGMAWVAQTPGASPEELLSRVGEDMHATKAFEAFLEDLVKRVAGEMTIVPRPREILLSGRLSRLPNLSAEVSGRLSQFAPVRSVRGFAAVSKEAAQGAALVGQGLLGGPLEHLVDVMRLRGACGSVLDHLYLEGAVEAFEQRLRFRAD